MTIHVGVYTREGKLSYCNDLEKITTDLEVKRVYDYDIDKIVLMYNDIKSKIDAEFGCICITLDNDFENKIRKEFIEAGLNIGFKNVEIINWQTARYIGAMSQIYYKPLNEDIIWIKLGYGFEVWQIKNWKAKYIGFWKADPSKWDNLETIVNESNLHKGPDIVLYDYKMDTSMLSKISAKCQFFIYSDEPSTQHKACLTKIRIAAGDRDLAHLDVEIFLSQNIILEFRQEEIMCFKAGQKLPIIFTLIKTSRADMFKMIPAKKTRAESFTLPDEREVRLTFKIDTNEIYYVKFDIQSAEEDSELKSDYGAIKLISEISSSQHIQSSDSYIIPKKGILFITNVEAIGIDLGTSRCCVAVNRNGAITTVALGDKGERLLPSYVGYDEKNVKCGQVVVNRLRHYSKSTIFDSKRIIGRCFNEIEIDDNWNFNVNFDTENKVFLEVNAFNGKKKITALEVAADLLKYMKKKTEEFQGTNITKAVITVPAAFTDLQKIETIEAAKLAGWKDINMLPEPIAAAFAYFLDRPISDNSNALLFDLGGGTLDVCIFKI